MQFRYLPTFVDFKESVRLHNRQKMSGIISGLFLLWFMPIVAALLLATDLYFNLKYPVHYSTGSSFTFACLFYCLLLPVIHLRKVRKQYRILYPNAVEMKGIEVDINDDFIKVTREGQSESKIYWNTITKVARNKSIAMFYLGESRYFLIPSHSLSPGQQEEFNDLVARHVTRKTL